jgi:hypothetical protein
MRLKLAAAFAIAVSATPVFAEELQNFQTLFDAHRVETRTLAIEIHSSRDDVHFSIALHDNETGLEKKYKFEGEGSTDPSPFQLEEKYLCGTPVILLTVKYPWQHALPEFNRVLDTFAFRTTDFSFIDVADGPLTEIALADDSSYDSADLDLLPPIRVRCLTGQDEKPFEFFRQENK